MNKEIIKEWLSDISTPTGLSYSGDQTLSNSMVDKIIEYIEEIEQENEQLKKQKDDVVEYIKKNKLFKYVYDEEELFEIVTDKQAKDELLRMLGEEE